jgi:hypothetical protein
VKRLYHFTAWLHYPDIIATGCLKTTESNLSPATQHFGPDVVWLTDHVWGAGAMLDVKGQKVAARDDRLPLVAFDKRGVRFTIDLPDSDCFHWPEWSRRHGIDRKWYRALGSNAMPWTWWVSQRPVLMGEVVETTLGADLSTWLELQGVEPLRSADSPIEQLRQEVVASCAAHDARVLVALESHRLHCYPSAAISEA